MKRFAGVLALLCLTSVAQAEERFPVLQPEQMTPDQRKVADSIMQSRKNLSGPFNAWLRSPELANRFQNVGEYVRYNTSLPKPLSEFAILITARDWTSQVEWQIHYPEGLAAGISPQILADLAANKRPQGMSADQTLVYDFTIGMHRDKGRVSDALFGAVKKRFGEKGLVDLIGLNGYYDAVAMTINAAEVPLPPGVSPPLK
jgi:4-carboxymuconolactone decarboxylase